MNKRRRCCLKCEHKKVCDINIIVCPMGNFDEYDYDEEE